MSCKRNAFMMLIQADQERALNYLSSCIDQVQSFGDILQLVIVELIYKVNNWEALFLDCLSVHPGGGWVLIICLAHQVRLSVGLHSLPQCTFLFTSSIIV